jgi:hypothetical protein
MIDPVEGRCLLQSQLQVEMASGARQVTLCELRVREVPFS